MELAQETVASSPAKLLHANLKHPTQAERLGERCRATAWKEEALDFCTSSLKGRERANVSQTSIGTVSQATFGKICERRGAAHMGFSERIDTILNGTELSCDTARPLSDG